MSLNYIQNCCYLGDGVYAEYDGYGVLLRTGSLKDSECDNKIYLEPDVLMRINEFLNLMKHIRKVDIDHDN